MTPIGPLNQDSGKIKTRNAAPRDMATPGDAHGRESRDHQLPAGVDPTSEQSPRHVGGWIEAAANYAGVNGGLTGVISDSLAVR